MELKEWKERNAKARKYAHFDEKVSLDNVWTYISNSDNIKKHGFYPFIHYEKVFNKFKLEELKEKYPAFNELAINLMLDQVDII